MKLRKINNNKQGYTLIELIIFVGLLALLMVAIYVIYDKVSNRMKANSLSKQLIVLSANIEQSFATLLSPTGLNNNYALNAQLVPKGLAGGSSTGITNTFGGGVTVAASGLNYTVTLDNIPRDVCALVGTSNFFKLANGISVNGTSIKTNGPLTSTHLSNIAINCGTNARATLVATYPITDPLIDEEGVVTPLRAKEDPRYIARIARTASGMTCSGGSSWNGTFCSCPSGGEWNGTSCIAFNTETPQAGWCQLGEGWLPDTKTCAPLPYLNPTIPANSQNNVYVNGKNLPSSVTTNRIQQDQKSFHLSEAYSGEVIAGRSLSWQQGNLDNQTLQMCVNGTWDTVSRTCVTPIPPN